MRAINLYIGSVWCIAALTNILFSLHFGEVLWLLLTCYLAIGIISDCIIIFRFKLINFPFLVFKTFYLTLILVEPFLSLIFEGKFSYEFQFGYYPESANNLVLVFHAFFILILTYFDKKIKLNVEYYEPKLTIKNILILLVFNIIGLYPYFRDGWSGFILLLVRGRSVGNSQFENSGLGNADLAIHLSIVLISLGCILGYYLIAIKRRNFFATLTLSTLFLANLMIVASSGTRTRVLFILVPLAIFYSYTVIVGFRTFSRWRALLGVFSALILFSAMAQFRVSGFSQLQDDKELELDLSGINLNNEFVYIVENFNEPVNNRNWFESLIYPLPEQFLKFLVNPIPRVIYRNKYVDPSFAEFNLRRIGYTGHDKTFNITPTIFGRFYLLYGPIGLLYVPLFLIVPLRILNKMITSNQSYSVLITCMLITFLCQSIRDLSPGWMYSTLISILIFALLD